MRPLAEKKCARTAVVSQWAPRTLTVTVSGSSVSATVNGVTLNATTSVTGGTFAGLYAQTNGAASDWPRFDTFSVS